MEHAPRVDDVRADPTGLKAKLAEYANATFANLLQKSGSCNRITLGRQTLDCQDGTWAYTNSVLSIIQKILPSQPRLSLSSDHTNCPQAIHARAQKQQQPRSFSHNSHRNIYNVHTENRFNILGN